MEIIIEEVIGWDMENECPTEHPGLFGICKAFIAAIEEQGCLSLHGHIQIWIEGFDDLRNSIFHDMKCLMVFGFKGKRTSSKI